MSGTSLVGANLSGASLKQADLEEVDFHNIHSIEGAYWEGARLERTLIPMEKLGGAIGEEKDKEWDAARRAYHGLRLNWAAQGEYDYARWGHRQEGHAKREDYQKHFLEGFKINKLLKAFLPASIIAYRQLDYHLWDHGQSPWRVMIGLVLLVLSFAGLYRLFGSLEAARWYDYPLFSLRTSATLVFSDIATSGDWIAKLLTGLEGALGLFLYAAIIYTLGRRSAGF